MIWITYLILALAVQAPAPAARVVIGMTDGQQVVVETPEFSGFVQGIGADAVLLHRRQNLHGQMPAQAISRIDFGRYEKDKPFRLTVTLRNGQKLEVESERQHFLTIKGRTELGMVYIKHPDPVGAPLRLSKKGPDRQNDLTIQYLEFPAP
jgi:hypothetical protein